MCQRINPRDRRQNPQNRKRDECDRNEAPRREDKADNSLVPSDPKELDAVANLNIRHEIKLKI